jgi:hypothetical protein
MAAIQPLRSGHSRRCLSEGRAGFGTEVGAGNDHQFMLVRSTTAIGMIYFDQTYLIDQTEFT